MYHDADKQQPLPPMAKSKPAPAPLRPAEKTYDIPTVSFRVITDDAALLAPAGVHSVSASCRSPGKANASRSRHDHMAVGVCAPSLLTSDNDFTDFERPAHYIRYIGAFWTPSAN